MHIFQISFYQNFLIEKKNALYADTLTLLTIFLSKCTIVNLKNLFKYYLIICFFRSTIFFILLISIYKYYIYSTSVKNIIGIIKM